MSHSDTLKLLIPLALGGTFSADLDLEGQALDAAQAAADILLDQTLPPSAHVMLADWERLTGMAPGPDEPVQSRRDKVIRKLQELGNIKKPYYVALAAALGYQIYIEEYIPTMAGWVEAGDELMIQDDERILFIWNAHIFNQSVYHFTAGQSLSGERLTWWRPATALENILDDLRPAHVQFVFSYE